MRAIVCWLAAWVLAGAAAARADGPSATTRADPELTPDRELLTRIAALPDNTWMKLPAARITGDLSWLKGDPDYLRQGPRVRDYCNKMVWAADRKRALYCGAGHNIHPWNDVWEFDLAANTWACLYGADPLASSEEWAGKNVVFRDRVIRTARGGPVRPAHTWWGLCYDPDRRRMVFWDAHKGLMFSNRQAIAKALGLEPGDPILSGSGSGPGEAWVFTFYPETRQWKEVLIKVPKAYESSALEYLPSRKALWLNSGQTYVLETDGGSWKSVAKGGPGGGAMTACDPDTRTIVGIVGAKTWTYAWDRDTWTVAVEDGPASACVPSGTFCFDSVARKFILYTSQRTRKDDNQAIPRPWVYDPRENKWTDPAPQGDVPKARNVAGYYDPERNVTVIYASQETWVYRCRKAAGGKGAGG